MASDERRDSARPPRSQDDARTTGPRRGVPPRRLFGSAFTGAELHAAVETLVDAEPSEGATPVEWRRVSRSDGAQWCVTDPGDRDAIADSSQLARVLGVPLRLLSVALDVNAIRRAREWTVDEPIPAQCVELQWWSVAADGARHPIDGPDESDVEHWWSGDEHETVDSLVFERVALDASGSELEVWVDGRIRGFLRAPPGLVGLSPRVRRICDDVLAAGAYAIVEMGGQRLVKFSRGGATTMSAVTNDELALIAAATGLRPS